MKLFKLNNSFTFCLVPVTAADLAETEAKTKKQLCRDIASSRLFSRSESIEEIHSSKNIQIFDECTGRTAVEYAFICRMITHSLINARKVKTYYISREYNVSNSSETFIAGRFIFWPLDDQIHLIALAEEPAKIVSTSSFNIEVHYLETRGEPSKFLY